MAKRYGIGVGLVISCLVSGCGGQTALATGQPVRPPQPQVSIAGLPVHVTQSSYCWKNGCVDYTSAETLLKNTPHIHASPNALVRVQFPTTDPPSQVALFVESSGQGHRQLHSLHLPAGKGTYYCTIQAEWAASAPHVNRGDASYVFAVDIK